MDETNEYILQLNWSEFQRSLYTVKGCYNAQGSNEVEFLTEKNEFLLFRSPVNSISFK